MAKKKRSLTETVTTIVIDGDEVVTEPDEGLDLQDWRANLREIRERDGVMGYILRDADSATIDFKDFAKTVEHAMLASQAFDSFEEIKEPLNLGNIESIVIECKNIKMLCIAVGDSTVSIFMEKHVDHAEIQKKLSFQPE